MSQYVQVQFSRDELSEVSLALSTAEAHQAEVLRARRLNHIEDHWVKATVARLESIQKARHAVTKALSV